MDDHKTSLRAGPMRGEKVFLYGHYDSRGGTTAIIAETREQADRIYIADFAVEGISQPSDYTSLIDEDFLCEAFLSGPLPTGSGFDLEWGLDGAVFLKTPAEEMESDLEDLCDYLSEMKTDIELLYVPKESVMRDHTGDPVPPEGYVHPRWDDDAVSFALLRP